MKKYILLILAMLFSMSQLSIATETKEKPLIPASSLDAMVSAGVNDDETASIENFDDLGRVNENGFRVICFARNARGERFESRGFLARAVQEEAMRQCYRVSRLCFALGCHRD